MVRSLLCIGVIFAVLHSVGINPLVNDLLNNVHNEVDSFCSHCFSMRGEIMSGPWDLGGLVLSNDFLLHLHCRECS